jgi:hypothetical protein
MSISLSTLLLFLLISPGFLFRFYLNHRSIVKRVRIASDAAHSILLLIIYSMVAHVFGLALLWIFLKLVSISNQLYKIELFYTDSFRVLVNGVYYDLMFYVLNHPYLVVLYLIYSFFIAYFLVRLLLRASLSYSSFARLVYGPLHNLVMPSPDFLTVFVLTNINHNGKRLMYSGYAKEVGIKDGAKVDYLILDNASKFYLSLTSKEPRTTLDNARAIKGLLFVDCDKIENVHFQSWKFA